MSCFVLRTHGIGLTPSKIAAGGRRSLQGSENPEAGYTASVPSLPIGKGLLSGGRPACSTFYHTETGCDP